MSCKGFQPDSDVDISFEDQVKINEFARYNARLEEYKKECDSKKCDLKNLEEACEEVDLCDNGNIPVLFGEIFIWNNVDKTQELLNIAKTKTQNEISYIEKKCVEITRIITELKAQLYNRFGSNIALENN